MRRIAQTVLLLAAGWTCAHTAVPAAEGGSGFVEPEFVGSYGADGKFKSTCKRSCFLLPGDDGAYRNAQARPVEVPRWIDLRPRETIVEDYEPPAYARKAVKGHNALVSLRDRIIAFVYGHESLLRAPTHVTTDSRRRPIVSDPTEPAVHVLDGKDSFRIVGGPGRRLQHPNGVAVDGDDNIYVADGKRGLVLVYDAQGRFLRYLGQYRGETMFANPTGIAIDRTQGRLYVLDSPANELIVLDLQGNVVRRVGGRRDTQSGVKFDFPSEIAVSNDAVVVLDSSGSRVQVLDLQGDSRNAFKVRNVAGRPAVAEIGLAVDSADNIYVSHVGWAVLRIYKPNGQRIGSLEHFGGRHNGFSAPSGAWVDAAGRIYVTDKSNSSIHVFEPPARVSPGKK